MCKLSARVEYFRRSFKVLNYGERQRSRALCDDLLGFQVTCKVSCMVSKSLRKFAHGQFTRKLFARWQFVHGIVLAKFVHCSLAKSDAIRQIQHKHIGTTWRYVHHRAVEILNIPTLIAVHIAEGVSWSEYRTNNAWSTNRIIPGSYTLPPSLELYQKLYPLHLSP